MRKEERTLREKTLLILYQNRESSLSSLEFHYSSRHIPTSSNQSENSPLIQFEIKPTAHVSNQARSNIDSTWRHQSTIQD